MSMSKRAIRPGAKVIVIDDFMRGGGSVTGISEMINEFGGSVVGVGVAISSKEPVKKRVSEYTAIVYLGNVDESSKMIDVSPNTDIF